MPQVLPSVNQRVSLELTRGESRTRYASTVLDLGLVALTVALPSVRAQWVLMETGSEIDVLYTSEDGVYRLTGTVTGRQTDPPARLIIAWSGVVTRDQRRSFVRVDLTMPVQYRRLTTLDRGSLTPVLDWNTGRVRDLSAGGMLLVPPEPLVAGEVVDLEFSIDGHTIQTSAEVIRCDKFAKDDVVESRAGLRFQDLPPSIEDRIVGFLFREQVRRRKEGRD